MLRSYTDDESPPRSNIDSLDDGDLPSLNPAVVTPQGDHGSSKVQSHSPLPAFRAPAHPAPPTSCVFSDGYSVPTFGIPNHVLRNRLAGTWRAALERSWARNRGLVLVLLSQLFGALMNVATRLLETDGEGMHPLQILVARMGITAVLCCGYMWYMNVPDFPLGKPEVRLLLVARGTGGFFGVYGMYYSLLYLPIAEATVITFLAPIVACWACSILIKEPFTRIEQIAGLVSLLGVVLIARPFTLVFGSNHSPIATGNADGSSIPDTEVSVGAHSLDNVTSMQRLGAVGVALLGVAGAACAYTTIRWIGKRAHPLISVNYFATWCSIVSVIGLLVIPGIGFRLPDSLRQWSLLVFLGTCGFVMQILLTAGLQHEKSSRATNMVYTQMLFALTFDKLVWGTTPGALSIVGSSLILGSAIYVALHKDAGEKESRSRAAGAADEERGLVEGVTDDDVGSIADEAEAAVDRHTFEDDVQMRSFR